ncbi:MAG: heavy metal-responsive transcriptional regulator [Bacteroidetes bacterium]|nr:MAG: heavy metal-responsive transcriptional regulator [Bacteroidota bacterium]
MEIREISRITGVSTKTIRYYEHIELLPPPVRKQNGYRNYSDTDVQRLKLVVGARHLDIPLAEIKEILDMRDRGQAPCLMLIDLLSSKTSEIETRIQELRLLQGELRQLYDLGLTYPTDDVEGKNCICHLVSEKVTINTA